MRKKPTPAGACTKCGFLVETFSEAEGHCPHCGGVMEPSSRLAGFVECQKCDVTGANLNKIGPAECPTCNGWGYTGPRLLHG